jgi:hypothetical protein
MHLETRIGGPTIYALMDTPVLRNLQKSTRGWKNRKSELWNRLQHGKKEEYWCVHLFYGHVMNNERNKKRMSGENGNVLAKISEY